ncbi:MAG: acyl-CoA thioesterase [Tannerella sp.]|jgi:acyl-CoA thioester hydrolase|nr:acyl-CoA thioesterase [Tannerella sp.]
MEKNKQLTASKETEIRFSEVDSMGIVWHGAYSLYFEDAREEFGRKYGIGYLDIFGNGFYAPLVDLRFSYKKPLVYGRRARTNIIYKPTEAAKIVFEYEIYDADDNSLIATGSSVQVFLDKDYRLVWGNPPFYEEWKKKWGV